jgi:hypothetical protein
MRCPIHGHVNDEEATVCPMGIRRTIAGNLEDGVCGQDLVPEYPADETDEG